MKPLVHPDSPFVTRPESTYKSGMVVQTTGATSLAAAAVREIARTAAASLLGPR